MSDTPVGQNKTVMYVLVGVAVLLALVVGLLMWQRSNALPGPDAAQPPSTSDAAGAAANSPQPTTQTAAPFDAKKATEVPSGKTPEEFLKTYYEAVKTKDWKTAYDCLPSDKKAGQTLDDFGKQLEGYGITDYSIDKPTTSGDEMTIVAYQVTGFGSFGSEWTFAKDGDKWLVKDKKMAGMK